MEIVDRGTVVAGEKGGKHSSCAFPGICILPDGRWICGFRAARTKASVGEQWAGITWSDDEGRNWSRPIEPFRPPHISGKEGRFRAVFCTALGGDTVLAVLYWVDASDPRLPFFNEKTQGLLDSKIFFSVSSDRGETWSSEWIMDTTPFNQPTPITGPILLLPNGEWICQFELNKGYYDPGEWRHSSVLMFSRDQGRSWPEHSVVTRDPANRFFYWDQRPALLDDGRILDLFWTYDSGRSTYLNMHARVSADSGRSWGEICDTGVPGQPAPAVSMRNARICLVYVDRTGVPVIKARSSNDGGQTWPVASEIDISEAPAAAQTREKKTMQDAWAEMGKFSIGLPATARAPNGDLVTVYYAGPETDLTDVKWARIRQTA